MKKEEGGRVDKQEKRESVKKGAWERDRGTYLLWYEYDLRRWMFQHPGFHPGMSYRVPEQDVLYSILCFEGVPSSYCNLRLMCFPLQMMTATHGLRFLIFPEEMTDRQTHACVEEQSSPS